MRKCKCWLRYDFYPRPPRGGRQPSSTTPASSANFYPRPPRGGRPDYFGISVEELIFLSTPSARRATAFFFSNGPARKPFLSTPSARRATYFKAYKAGTSWISIHALREEGDSVKRRLNERQKISIHALREEGDQLLKHIVVYSSLFLSTPSARRATFDGAHITPRQNNFYPRPPRGGRRRGHGDCLGICLFLSTPSARRATHFDYVILLRNNISIHALREEGDMAACQYVSFDKYFYPRPPRGGRPAGGYRGKDGGRISIHALREEGDLAGLYDPAALEISIHALREEGDEGRGRSVSEGKGISIHALREEGDGSTGVACVREKHFYPRPPRGGRHDYLAALKAQQEISIHALREEGDRMEPKPRRKPQYFYPRPPRGGRPLESSW